jgi:peptidoglycan/LPS O-acetylase OafA/YrhL
MRQLSVKGIVVGGVVDIVATNVLALPVVIVAGIQANIAALPREQQTRAVIDTLQGTPSLYATQFVLGALASVLGGYVAAKVAKRGALLNGALSAFLCVGSGVYAMAAKTDAVGPLAHVGFLIASPLLGALGGWLWERRQSRLRVTPAAV